MKIKFITEETEEKIWKVGNIIRDNNDAFWMVITLIDKYALVNIKTFRTTGRCFDSIELLMNRYSEPATDRICTIDTIYLDKEV